MGNAESMESQLAVIRSRAAPVRLPMPDPAELEERFSIALVSTHHRSSVSMRMQVFESFCRDDHSGLKGTWFNEDSRQILEASGVGGDHPVLGWVWIICFMGFSKLIPFSGFLMLRPVLNRTHWTGSLLFPPGSLL